MALMLHATCYNATVAPFIGGVITLIMGGLPARIVSVSELKESTFVIPRANFFLMFYCPFRKKRYICRRGTLNNLNCRKPQKSLPKTYCRTQAN